MTSDVDVLCLDDKIKMRSTEDPDKIETKENVESAEWTPLLLLAAIVACLGSALPTGYNIGVVNNVREVLIEYLNQTTSDEFTSSRLDLCYSSIISIFLVAGAASSLSAGFFADRFGRKGALIIGNIFGVLGGLALFVIKYTDWIALFWVGRILVGFSGGLATSLVPVYTTELAPLKLRGAMGVLCQLGITVGVLLGQILSLNSILGNSENWHYLLFIVAPIGFISIITTLILPESPKYLYVVKEDTLLAQQELARLRNKDKSVLQGEISLLNQEALASENNEAWSIWRVIKSSDLRLPLVLVCLMQGGQQMSGINSVFYYSNTIFKMAGLSNEGSQYATIGTGIANVFMAVVSTKLLLHFGRRKLFLLSCYSSAFCLFVLFLAVQLKSVNVMTYVAIVSMTAFVFTYGLGLGPIPYFIGSELFDSGPRPAATAMGSMCNWAGNFIVGMFFTVIVGLIGAPAYFVFIISLGLLAFIIYKYLPETFGKTTTDISRQLASGRRREYDA